MTSPPDASPPRDGTDPPDENASPDPARLTQTLVLIHEAQDGSEDALNTLLARYYERVRRIVRLRLGTRLRSRLDSGDILQETFIAAVSGFERFEVKNESSLINWLSKIAERQILAAADHHSAQKRDAAREIPLLVSDESGRIGLDPAASGVGPLDQLSQGEQSAQLEKCIEQLEEQYRELIIMRNYAGASWDQVAEHCGRPSGAAARMMYSKALIELTKLVRAERED